MSHWSQEDIERMFADFGLAREEDRKYFLELANLGNEEEAREEFIKIDSTTDVTSGEGVSIDAKLA